MNKHRRTIYGLLLAVLLGLVYLQFREWRTFDWSKFLEHTRDVSWLHVGCGILLIYLAYVLRALRWKIFLRPVRKDVSAGTLISPTLIGFTGLVVLGRPGELIRPYLIARRVNLSFSSQLAVWAVERIFDLGAFTVLMVGGIFLPTELREFAVARPAYHHWLHVTGYLLSGLVLLLFAIAMLVSYQGPRIADWAERRLSHFAQNLGDRIAQRVREFSRGLHTIHDPFSFLQLAVISLVMWWMIAVSYEQVTHAYGRAMEAMSTTQVLLLMGSSMVGSMIQLPGVGGGSQLATIAMLNHVFDVPPELAASAGIMLWLVTFVAVIPVGLFLAHRERLSLRKLSEESHQNEGDSSSAELSA